MCMLTFLGSSQNNIKEGNPYGLTKEEQDLMQNGNYDHWNFEEEDLEEDDYYYEDDLN